MSKDAFVVVVHHHGHFDQIGRDNYIGGETTIWECDPDTWSYYEVIGVLKDIGYVHIEQLWYAVDTAMLLLCDDNGAMNMMKVARHCGEVHLFVVHGVSKAEVVENNLDGEGGSKGTLESGDGSGVHGCFRGKEVHGKVGEGEVNELAIVLYKGADVSKFVETSDGCEVQS